MSIKIPIISDFDGKGIRRAQAEFRSLEKTSEKASFIMQRAAVPAGAAMGVLAVQIGKAVKAAAEDQKAQEQLELAIRNNTSANTDQIKAVEDVIGKMEMQKAVADDELRPAYGNLIRATGDVAKAQDLLNLALDISSATGRDLQSVTLALSKAQTGQVSALTRLGIPLDAAAVKSKDLDAIQADLAVRFAGASDAAAASAEGGMAKLQIALDNTYEAVGYRLLPVISDYITVLGDLASKALAAEGGNNKLLSNFGKLFKIVFPIVKGIETLNKVVGNQAKNVRGVGNQYDVTNIAQRRLLMGKQELVTKIEDETKKTKTNTTAKDRAAKAAEKLRKATEAAKEAIADATASIRSDFTAALDSAKAKLGEAQSAFDNFAKSVSDTLTSSVNFRDAYDAGVETGGGFIAGLTDQTAKIKNFGVLVNRLIAGGLSERALTKVLDAGVEAGSAIAEELLNGAGNILKANELVAEVQDIADLVGRNSATRFYETGVLAGQSLVAGIQASIAAFELRINTPGMTVGGIQNAQSEFALGIPTGDLGFLDLNLGNIMGHVPMFANGGIVTSPTLGIIGEAGPEAVIPLDRMGGMGGINITVNAGLVSTPDQIGQEIIQAIQKAQRRSGPVFAPA